MPTAEIHSQISQQGSFYPKLGGPPISSVDCGLNSHGSYSFSNSPSQASGLVSYQDRDMLDALHSLSSPESVSSHEEVPEFFNTLDFSEPEQDDIVTPLSLPPETNGKFVFSVYHINGLQKFLCIFRCVAKCD